MTALLLLLAPTAAPLDLDPDELRPGLVGEYRSLAEPRAVVHRIDPKPSFTLGRSSPHPRLPAGPFEVTWTGVLAVRDPGPLAFSAIVGGEVTVTIDGVTVLDGRGAIDTSRVVGKDTLTREPGYYPLTVRYRSLADVPARLQLWWEGPSFAAEVIPAWRFGHVGKELSPATKQDTLAARGQALAGKFGCARCHVSAMPAVTDPPPGPALADAGRRLNRAWLLDWLADPAKVRPDAHMPALFANDRAGLIERWVLADQLAGEPKKSEPVPGDHRAGRQAFLGLGCTACHLVPDIDRREQADLNRTPLVGLGDRLSAGDLAAFLGNPHGRYPDGRMPRLPITPDQARDIAAYLLLWLKPTERPAPQPPTAKEIQETVKRLGARDAKAAAVALIGSKGCASCHPGLGDTRPLDVPVRQFAGCLTGEAGPRFALDDEDSKALTAFVKLAAYDRHPSPFVARQEKLARAGCVQCHQRDTDRPPPVEQAGSTLGGAHLMELPFQRTPRLTNPHQKLTRAYLGHTVREGNPGLRGPRYTYRMPAFGLDADELVQALAEADGELVAGADVPARGADDPTLGTLHGARLAGFQGYACASCHVWNNRLLAPQDPVATGPDLTRTAGRVRRDWFDRFVENPLRYYPGTPMPNIFPHGQRATLAVLDGDAAKQKDALWAYLALGKEAPSPKPPPPVPIDAPSAGEGPIVAQIPIRFPDGKVVESLSLLSAQHDLLVYDLGEGSPHRLFTGGQILRNVQGRIRQFLAAGTPLDLAPAGLRLVVNNKSEAATERTLLGYDRVANGARVRWKVRFPAATVEIDDWLRLPATRDFVREVWASGLPAGSSLELRGPRHSVSQVPGKDGRATVTIKLGLPPARVPPAWDVVPVTSPDPVEGSLERPGYKAVAYPRPKTVSGEDRIMPGAVAVRPKDGQVFVASLKTGELFALRDPSGDGKSARFENYGHGLFQDALSMKAEDDGLYVLHRRNLTKVTESHSFERVAALPHGIADTYDMAYGLARDRKGNWVFGYAPYANTSMPGSGGAVRLAPGKPVEEIAYGMRNPLGWCAGPEGEVFFTDNQGDWVATNKLCHLEAGKFYGWPNAGQKRHHADPPGKAAVWVPYGWAHSINGVAHDDTGGKFGPFAGQLFLAELMFGGAIIRADMEKVNGVYQGACFPFWGKGLLGPLCLAFDPKGKLYVGGVTEPGWMAQPDRGALFRIDYTGKVPFEMQTIRARPNGFRVVFTAPVDPKTAGDPASYRLEHYRYEYTGAYGSPELDRTAVKVEAVHVSRDGLSAELTTAPLVKDRVYLLTASGVRSARNEALVNPAGAYTVNEVPK
jgi:mono/diheme cytochrome c family protein